MQSAFLLRSRLQGLFRLDSLKRWAKAVWVPAYWGLPQLPFMMVYMVIVVAHGLHGPPSLPDGAGRDRGPNKLHLVPHGGPLP